MSFERAKNIDRKRAAIGLGVLTMAVGGAVGGVLLSRPGREACMYAHQFPGDPNAIEGDQQTEHEGADIQIPNEPVELERVGYTDPGGNWHYSQLLPLTHFALRIGPNAVTFQVQSEPRLQPVCATFTEKPYKKILEEGGIDPFTIKKAA